MVQTQTPETNPPLKRNERNEHWPASKNKNFFIFFHLPLRRVSVALLQIDEEYRAFVW